MDIINRKIQPEIKLINEIGLIRPDLFSLKNGIPVYLVNNGEQNLTKIEFLFRAGRWFEDKLLVASFTNKMLKEGTSQFTAAGLADKIDFYGAHVESSSDKDMAYVSLYSLNKYLEETLPVFADMILNPTFPEKELDILKQNRKQHFLVNSEKVRYLAKRKFNEQIFGNRHPYGKLFNLEDFDRISRDDLVTFHEKQYSAGQVKIIVSGKVPPQLPDLLNKYFSELANTTTGKEPDYRLNGFPVQPRLHVEKQNAVQSAVRIGKKMFNKTHPDYFKIKIFNTVLGGYFGSRLMTNIREDKGYTYGIGSAVVSLQNAGYFFIATEVGTDVTRDAINEVYHEINLLQQDTIPVEELNLVKNYMLGSFLRSMDGPFAIAENLKGLIEFGLDYDFYNRFIETVQQITPEELREIARKYFSKESMCELTVGN